MENKILLSILICTIETRKELLNTLHNKLLKQIEDGNYTDEVEILIFSDMKQLPVGMKRNLLIQAAKGEFTCFVDDDDDVSDDYVSLIVEAIRTYPNIDCVGFVGYLISKELGNRKFRHSLIYKEYSEDSTSYYRPPNHLSPMRRELIKDYKFPVISFGEDADWCMRICNDKVLKTEYFIPKILYYYYFEYSKSETQRMAVL